MITLGGSPQLAASPMSLLNSCVYMGLFAKFMFEFVLTLLYCYWRNNRSFPLQVIKCHIKIQQGGETFHAPSPHKSLVTYIYMYIFLITEKPCTIWDAAFSMSCLNSIAPIQDLILLFSWDWMPELFTEGVISCFSVTWAGQAHHDPLVPGKQNPYKCL